MPWVKGGTAQEKVKQKTVTQQILWRLLRTAEETKPKFAKGTKAPERREVQRRARDFLIKL